MYFNVSWVGKIIRAVRVSRLVLRWGQEWLGGVAWIVREQLVARPDSSLFDNALQDHRQSGYDQSTMLALKTGYTDLDRIFGERRRTRRARCDHGRRFRSIERRGGRVYASQNHR